VPMCNCSTKLCCICYGQRSWSIFNWNDVICCK